MKLTDHIVEHIFTNLGMINVKQNSIFLPELIIEPKITFEENGKEQHHDVFVCEGAINQAKMIIAAAKIENEDHTQELLAVISLENSPTYGCRLSLNEKSINDGVIVFQIKDKTWLEANIFIQASFLAGMEQLRDLSATFTICSQTESIYQHLLTLIKYLDDHEG